MSHGGSPPGPQDDHGFGRGGRTRGPGERQQDMTGTVTASGERASSRAAGAGRERAALPGSAAEGRPTGPQPPRWTRRLESWRARWRVPGILRAALVGCLALTLALGALCAAIPLHTGSAWQAIQGRTAPQVRHSSGLYLALTDMDAQTANLLVFGDDAALAAHRSQAVRLYGQDRDTVSRELQGATKAAGDDPAAQAALVQILDGLGRYEEAASRATSLNDAAHAPAGHPAPAALTAYRQATDLMRTALLPAADRLITTNNAAFTAAYDGERSFLAAMRLAALGLGLLTLAALAALQLFLVRRFHRVFSPGLVAAAVLSATVLATAFTVTGDERETLRYARHDAFDSVVALSAARAVAYDANADESRNLLDPQRSGQYSGAFLDKSQQIARIPGADLPGYASEIEAAWEHYRRDHRDVRFSGYLGTEFRNLTFPGERAAAEQALAGWVAYQHDDQVTRGYLATGQLAQAIRFNTSWDKGGSDYHFGRFDDAMKADVAINATAFDHAVSDGRAELDTALAVIGCCAALAVALAAAGVRPRLAEFR